MNHDMLQRLLFRCSDQFLVRWIKRQRCLMHEGIIHRDTRFSQFYWRRFAPAYCELKRRQTEKRLRKCRDKEQAAVEERLMWSTNHHSSKPYHPSR